VVKQHSSSERRVRKQRGSAILEFGLGGTAFFALLFAGFDFGNHLFHKTAIRTATREGLRFGITGQTLPGLGQDDSIKEVVKRNSMGTVRDGHCAEKITINYYDRATGDPTAFNTQGNILEVNVTNCSVSSIAPILRVGAALEVGSSAIGSVENYPHTPPVR
jgi:Flp pilus assembly protein TadG